MKTILVGDITLAVKKLCMEACVILGEDVLQALERAYASEESPVGREILGRIIENAHIAKTENLPLCQDTGMAVLFLEIGQEVHFEGGSLTDAIHEGVRLGYRDGYLRKSVLHPITRINTGDNTPAVIHTEIVPGDGLKIIMAPKGFGSENMSRV